MSQVGVTADSRFYAQLKSQCSQLSTRSMQQCAINETHLNRTIKSQYC